MKQRPYSDLKRAKIAMLAVLIGAVLEAAFNLFELWIPWNLFAYLCVFFIFPLSVVIELISTGGIIFWLISNRKNDAAIEKKRLLVLPFVYIAVTAVIIILFSKFVCTWGFV